MEINSDQSHKSYRPLTTLSFRLSRIIAGSLDARAFHIHNVVLHTVVTGLFTMLCGNLVFTGKATLSTAESTELAVICSKVNVFLARHQQI
jgi:hypothetical protein